MIKTSAYGIDIFFPQKPSQKIIDSLKACGFKWNSHDYCWHIHKNEENMILAEKFEALFLGGDSPEFADKIIELKPIVTIKMADIIIRSNSFYCNLHHDVTDIIGHITIIDKTGQSKEKSVPLAYCATCNTYFILEETYKNLKKQGIICGWVMKHNEYVRNKQLDTSYWNEKSPLKMWGYNVSREEDLSTAQRWAILERIVDSGIMSLDRLLSYLDFFIRIHSNEDAIYCWAEDRKHMEAYISKYASTVYIFG